MSKHDGDQGDGTPDDPMVVLSDESADDGHGLPQPDNGKESSPDSFQETEQNARDGGASQTLAATGNQSGVAPALSASSSAATLPAPLRTNTPAFTAVNVLGSIDAGAHSVNANVVAGSAAAANQNIAPAAGVPSGATVIGSVPANAAAPGTAAVATIIGTVPAGVNQALRHKGETFTPHPTDPSKMIARFRVEVPHNPGHYYEQVNTIPMLDETATSPDDPPYYFIPNLTRSKVEKKIRASKRNGGQPNLWVRQGTSNTWIRKDPEGGRDQVFNLTVIFRRFNKVTHKYEQMYDNLGMLRAADPNTKKWMYAYNKWIDQIRRRQDDDYVQKVKKDHWSVAERRSLCIAINAHVRKVGLRRFGSGPEVKITQADMQVVADTVNGVGGMNRAPDSVRSQIFSSHQKKNKCVFDLINRANDLRSRLNQGEKISRDERYPYDAIPPATFPKDAIPKKKRRASAMEEDAASELSDAPADLHSPTPAAEAPDPAWLQNFLDSGDATPSSIRPMKQIRFSTGSGNELPIGDEWADTDEEILSERGEQLRAEMDWETTDGEATGSEDGESWMDKTPLDENDQDEGRSADEDSTGWLSDDEQQDRDSQDNPDLQAARQRSLQNGPISVGVPVPGQEDSDDSDSDSENDVPHERPVATPLRKAAKGKQRGQASVRFVSPSPEKKRKRTPQSDEEEGSEGDVEAETAPPQGRSAKKVRTRGAK